jgi:hypothetical protein
MSGLLAFTLFHVALSVAAIGAGFVVVYGLLNGRSMGRWTMVFLAFTVATTFTGFLFPFRGFTPALGTGIVSTVFLILAVAARYRFHMAGRWRSVYIVSAMVSLYLNCFVFVVQAFQKVPALRALAPNGNEPAFAATQGVVLLTFVILGYLAVKWYRGEMMPMGR